MVELVAAANARKARANILMSFESRCLQPHEITSPSCLIIKPNTLIPGKVVSYDLCSFAICKIFRLYFRRVATAQPNGAVSIKPVSMQAGLRVFVLCATLLVGTLSHQQAVCSSIDIHMFCFQLTLRAKNYKKTAVYHKAAASCFPALQPTAASCQISEQELHQEFADSISKADYITRSAKLIVRCQKCVRAASGGQSQHKTPAFKKRPSTSSSKDPVVVLAG